MDKHVYLLKIDMDYRVWSRKVDELNTKPELTDDEKRELDNYKELMRERLLSIS